MGTVPVVLRTQHGVVDLRQLLRRKLDVDHGADDLDDVADVLLGRGGGHVPVP